MQSRPSLFLLLLRVCVRLGLGLVLLAGLGLLAVKTAHAQPAATITVSTCDESHLDAAISNAASGDTLSFGCSGNITLTKTLTISKNLTLDGNGHSVTLDGNNSVQVLSVSSGVTFILNALTIAHGSSRDGGGLSNLGTMTITNSTIANNSATSDGGLSNLGTMTITNSTIANNSASGGGGLGNFGTSTMTITNSTIANNSSPFGGGLVNAGSLTLSQSIVANNTGGGGDCHLIGPSFTDQGYNLDSDGTCGLTTANHDLPSTNPQLGPLADNGGPTQTLALLPGSPANDTIPSARCPSTDQRGVTRPDNAETACDIGAYEFVDPPPDNDLGLTNVPANITVDATSPQGATVTYTSPTATDESGDSSTASVNCTPASGSTFAIGTTTVTCTATDSDDTNSPVSASFTVTVNDTDLGLTNVPSNMTFNATSPQGAVVSYTSPTVVDEDSSLPTASCSPTSGSTFAIGTTKVTCTATDSDDTPSPVSTSFTVTVNGAATQVSSLISTVQGLPIASGLKASLLTQLQTVQADLHANNTAQACIDLTSFINHVKAQSGKGLTVSQANQLIAAAKQIQAVLGC